jgi:catechol 2,3-dioxygenase-like lactoylglutathione lyase family enzyme
MNLNQVTVPVTDVTRSINFYQSLGLKLIVRSLPHYARFECPEGDATFSLHLADKQAPGGIWLYFEVAQLDEYINELMQKGILVDEMPEDKPWLWREARLKDPDNNQLIIYHAGSNRKSPPWRLQE